MCETVAVGRCGKAQRASRLLKSVFEFLSGAWCGFKGRRCEGVNGPRRLGTSPGH